MVNLNNYFIGLITRSTDYYDNPKHVRYIADVNFDPFLDESIVNSVVLGIPTLLEKIEADTYTDLYNSRYKNELIYKSKCYNELGICLVYEQPFLKYYKKKPIILNETFESLDDDMMLKVLNNGYYIYHDPLYKSDDIIIVDDVPFDDLKISYVDEYFPEEARVLYKKTKNK